MRDVFSPCGGHVFLVLEEGRNEVAALRRHLHRDRLSAAQRLDLPYIPHITVAADADYARCEAIAEETGRAWTTLRARVEALTVVRILGAQVTSLVEKRLLLR